MFDTRLDQARRALIEQSARHGGGRRRPGGAASGSAGRQRARLARRCHERDDGRGRPSALLAAAAGDRRQGRRDPHHCAAGPRRPAGFTPAAPPTRTQEIDQGVPGAGAAATTRCSARAVQLMGVVAQGGQGAAVLQRSSPADRARNRVAAARRPSAKPSRRAWRRQRPRSQPQAPEAGAPEAGAEPSLRGRLRLTPTATDGEFKAAFDAAGGQAALRMTPAGPGRSCLTTLDGDGEAKDGAAGANAGSSVVDLGRLGEALFNEIEAMAIDAWRAAPLARPHRGDRRGDADRRAPPAPARWSAPSPRPLSAASRGGWCRSRRSGTAP